MELKDWVCLLMVHSFGDKCEWAKGMVDVLRARTRWREAANE